MVKKENNLRFGKKIFSSSKTGESVGNAKQTIYYFWPYFASFLTFCLKKNTLLSNFSSLYIYLMKTKQNGR